VARWLGAEPRPLADRAQAATVAGRWGEAAARDERYGCWAVQARDTGGVVGSVEAFRLAAPDRGE
jgi:hypothetical protein